MKIRERFPKLKKVEYILYQIEQEETGVMKEEIANGTSSLRRLEDAKNSGGVDVGHN